VTVTSFLTIVTHDPSSIAGLTEQLRYWEGQVAEIEPRIFAVGSVTFRLAPLPTHHGRRLGPELTTVAECLTLDEATLLDWMHRNLTAETEDALRSLLTSLRQLPDWRVIYEAGRGNGERTVVCDDDLFECIASALADDAGYDLTTILPPEGAGPPPR
jgi:hypothetical protein